MRTTSYDQYAGLLLLSRACTTSGLPGINNRERRVDLHQYNEIQRHHCSIRSTTRMGLRERARFGCRSQPAESLGGLRVCAEITAAQCFRPFFKRYSEKVAADNLFVFMHTGTFNKDSSTQTERRRGSPRRPTTPAKWWRRPRLGERLWRDGFRYSKYGVMISELPLEAVRQPALWGDLDKKRRERAQKSVNRLNATLERARRMWPGSCWRNIAHRVGSRAWMNCRALSQGRRPWGNADSRGFDGRKLTRYCAL